VLKRLLRHPGPGGLLIAALVVLLVPAAAWAGADDRVDARVDARNNTSEGLAHFDTRPGVVMPVYRMHAPGAPATLLLLSGGTGGMGRIEDGRPTSKNFLVRSRDDFVQAGFDVAVLGLPSDKKDGLSASDRLGAEHLEDLRSVVRQLEADTGLPVWLVGTSMGTVSATAAAIAYGREELAGVVLTSSLTSRQKTGAVPTQNLAAIRIPVLVLHHAQDACTSCMPSEAAKIVRWLDNAPVRKFILVDGGEGATGNPCGPLHHHGYIGMEPEAVRLVTDWIRHPVP
jgi:pimeloyl-ACP methyl ester carboxylesterase